jgi:hypothetical protein
MRPPRLLEAKIDEFGPRDTLDDGKRRQVPFRGWSGSALAHPARVGVSDEWHVDLRKSAVQNGIGKMASLA